MHSDGTALKVRYGLLALLFAAAVVFQAAFSAAALRHLFHEQAGQVGSGGLGPWAMLFNLQLATPLACLLLGFYVAAVRVYDGRAWLLLAVLWTFSLVADGNNRLDAVMAWRAPLNHIALIYRSALLGAWPICMLLFAIYFPERAELDRRRPWLKWLLLGPASVECVLWVLATAARVEASPETPPGPMGGRIGAIHLWMLYGFLALFLVLLLVKLVRAHGFDDRRRLKVLLYGLACSFVPAFGVSAAMRQMHHMRYERLPLWLVLPAFSAFVLFPVTLAYVVLVQRVLDVRMILRQGLQYALARRGLLVLQVSFSSVVILLVALLSGHLTFPDRLLLTVAGIGVIALAALSARRVAGWIDRRFFREAYNTEQLLAKLAETAGSLVELRPLLSTVATRLSEVLHISEIAVFLNEQSCYRMALAVGYEAAPETEFRRDSRTIEELHRTNQPVPVYLGDQRSWTADLNEVDALELERLKAQLLLPLARREELLGFLSLGRRYSDAPYSKHDLQLLHSVAQQTALAVENSKLALAIAADKAQREVLERELAIAREVQQRLLPQSFPEMEGLRCFGTCRPAQVVGGDYYDFLQLQGDLLGIAIGDVSGKGIPASLLVASLQAFLRGQALSGGQSLEQVMANLNQLVYDASTASRYATFFYGQYDAGRGRLTYVNAGHNAPVVLRGGAGGGGCTRLDVGGVPIGMLPQTQYESGMVDLGSGDVVVLFSDGITEAMNGAEEEWGEENLLASLRGARDRPPEEVVAAAFAAADRFAGGAAQHDDMTLVVLSVTGLGVG